VLGCAAVPGEEYCAPKKPAQLQKDCALVRGIERQGSRVCTTVEKVDIWFHVACNMVAARFNLPKADWELLPHVRSLYVEGKLPRYKTKKEGNNSRDQKSKVPGKGRQQTLFTTGLKKRRVETSNTISDYYSGKNNTKENLKLKKKMRGGNDIDFDNIDVMSDARDDEDDPSFGHRKVRNVTLRAYFAKHYPVKNTKLDLGALIDLKSKAEAVMCVAYRQKYKKSPEESSRRAGSKLCKEYIYPDNDIIEDLMEKSIKRAFVLLATKRIKSGALTLLTERSPLNSPVPKRKREKSDDFVSSDGFEDASSYNKRSKYSASTATSSTASHFNPPPIMTKSVISDAGSDDPTDRVYFTSLIEELGIDTQTIDHQTLVDIKKNCGLRMWKEDQRNKVTRRKEQGASGRYVNVYTSKDKQKMMEIASDVLAEHGVESGADGYC
jgi:hypothetical protein